MRIPTARGSLTTSSTGSTNIFFQRWDGNAWRGSPVEVGGRRALPLSAIGTGDGYLVAAATYVLGTSTAFPDDHREYSIRLYHFASDGSLRETISFEDHAYYPRLAWAGGRIAMTFTRVSDVGAETRHLVFFDCP